MPEPWEFDIEFDDKTGHVKRVVAGDNGPYQQYIEAQNIATDASRQAVQKLIPVAEKCGVIMISGEADGELASQTLNMGAADFIYKPFDLEYLETSLLAKLLTMGKP